MPILTGLVAGFIAAGIAGYLRVSASPFDSDGMRSHVVALLGSTVALSLLASFIDINLDHSLIFQDSAIQVAIWCVIGYCAGIVGSYAGEILQDNGIIG